MFVGFNSIGATEFASNKNLISDANVEYSNFEKISDFSLNVSFLEIGLSELGCTATVYLDGEYQTHFTMTTCAAAYAAACAYIQERGGVCPPATGIN